MTIRELTNEEIETLVGTRHAGTGMEYPPNGLQPYYQWLMRALHLLAEASASALRVAPDQDTPTAVCVAPGRATVGGSVLAYTGGTVDLAAFNNATAYVWLHDAGGAAVTAGASSAGWPATPHLKLAEVTLAGGQITSILDRRFEAMLCGVGSFASVVHDHANAAGGGLIAAATTSSRGAVKQAGADSDTAAFADNSGGIANPSGVESVEILVVQPDGDPSSAAALRDDLCGNTLPALENDLSTVRDAVAALAACCNRLIVDLNDLRAKMRTAGLLAN
jgi:hypothetical protein